MRRGQRGGDMQRDLVERAQAGDHDAFSVLVRASYPRLYGVANLILRDWDRAQDAVQEALVLAWRDIRALRDADAWDAWLYRLTVRACYRSARKVKRRDVVELHVLPDPEPAGAVDFSASVAERDRIGRELGRLPIDQRAVMVLHFYLDLPLTEAADILDIPVGTAKSRLHRGLDGPARRRCATEPDADSASSGSDPHDHRQSLRTAGRRLDGGRGRSGASRTGRSTRSSPPRAGRGRLPRWLALIKEPPMRLSSESRSGHRRPTLGVLVVAIALIALRRGDRRRRQDPPTPCTCPP